MALLSRSRRFLPCTRQSVARRFRSYARQEALRSSSVVTNALAPADPRRCSHSGPCCGSQCNSKVKKGQHALEADEFGQRARPDRLAREAQGVAVREFAGFPDAADDLSLEHLLPHAPLRGGEAAGDRRVLGARGGVGHRGRSLSLFVIRGAGHQPVRRDARPGAQRLSEMGGTVAVRP